MFSKSSVHEIEKKNTLFLFGEIKHAGTEQWDNSTEERIWWEAKSPARDSECCVSLETLPIVSVELMVWSQNTLIEWQELKTE